MFDSPISISTNAYEKAHRHRKTPSCELLVKKRKHSPVFTRIADRVLHPLKKSIVASINRVSGQTRPSTLAKDSAFFRLSFETRGEIYGVYVFPFIVFYSKGPGSSLRLHGPVNDADDAT